MQFLTDGGFLITGRLDIPGEGSGDFVFGRGWLLEVVELTGGDYYFISDGREIRPRSKRFGVFYPSFTFVRAVARNVRGYNRGVGSENAPSQLPDEPFIFETDHDKDFTSIRQDIDVLEHSTERQPITVNTAPSAISLRTKRLIDENYLVYPSIGRIAARLKVSHEHLSRQFKKDYGVSPSTYLHNLRVADATYRLSLGEEIIDISMDVGYNDLSRFYKQFRKATQTSPAVCRKQIFE